MTGLLGKHPAGNGLLEGGCNSLLESAQEATLTSVTTPAFPRQSNSLAIPRRYPHCNRKFTLGAMQTNGLRANTRFFARRQARMPQISILTPRNPQNFKTTPR
jgi:hypothetical protein